MEQEFTYRHKQWWINKLLEKNIWTSEDLSKKKMSELKQIAEQNGITPTKEDHGKIFRKAKKEPVAKKAVEKVKINDEFDTFDEETEIEDTTNDEESISVASACAPKCREVRKEYGEVRKQKKFLGIKVNGLLILGNLSGNSIEFI
jgi:hypothetical protein